MSGADGRPVFEVEQIRLSYLGRFPALAGVTLTVEAGEQIALLGPNGCGKSTLLKVLAGLVFPDSGTVRAFGRDLTSAALTRPDFFAEFRRQVGLLFQNSDAQLFNPTVFEEVAFGPNQLGFPPAEVRRRVQEMLALLEIDGLADRAPFQLSEGQKRRVALAAVLAVDPDVLLLDEPTTGLDPRTNDRLVEILWGLRRLGKTVLVATHDLELARLVADRALIIGEDHRVWADGPVGDVLADRALLYRANLVGRAWGSRAAT